MGMRAFVRFMRQRINGRYGAISALYGLGVEERKDRNGEVDEGDCCVEGDGTQGEVVWVVDEACQIGGIQRVVERLYRRHYLL